MRARFQNILLYSLLLISVYARSEKIPYKRCSVKTLNYEQGLLNNSITDIITDPNGFTWVSTYTGLQRYNGYSLETINPVVNKKTIIINYPVHFFGLADGHIWISYKQGIVEYSSDSNSFRNLLKVPAKSFFAIVPLMETATGIWCLQQDKGIVLYNRLGSLVKNIPMPGPAFFNDLLFSSTILFSNVISSNDRFIYIRQDENNIIQIDTKTERYQIVPFNGFVRAVGCSKNNLYVISDKGLFSRNIYTAGPFKNILGRKLPDENIGNGSILVDSTGRIFFSVNRHFYEIDTPGSNLQEFTQLNKELILSTGTIQKIYVDKFKRIWLLTNNDIKRIQDVNVPFDEFSYPNEKNNFIRSIYFDEDRHIIVAGAYNGTLQLYDTTANQLLETPLVNTAAGYILSIQKLSPDEYLLYTYGNGFFIFNLKQKTIRSLPEFKTLFENNNFENNTLRINDSTILISTSKDVYRCVIINGRIASVTPLFPAHAAANERLGCFICNSKNTIWVGTLQGSVVKVDASGNYKKFAVPEGFVVRSITQTNENRIWVGTEQALYVFDTTGKLIRSFTRETGLLNDCIYALLPAGTDEVYASTNFGLSYVREDGTIRNFTKELGLQENEFNTGAAMKTRAGKFFFGGVNGITAFYPAKLSNAGDLPVINITRFIVNDSLVVQSSKVSKQDTVVLRYDQNRLQLDFAALGVFNNTDYEYDYRLKGFEESWQHTHQPTGIKYNLAPGTYTLEIICRPMLSFNSSFTKNMTIIITPPFWKTWWFELAAVLIFSTLLFVSIRYYNRRKYVAKIRELQSQQEMQRERERISRELHDNIGSQLSFISSNIDWLIDRDQKLKADEKADQMKAINKTAKNIMMNLRETIWALNKETISVSEFSDKLKAYIIHVIELRPEIKFTSEEHISENIGFTSAETLNIFRICQEIVTNVMKHANASVLKLSISSDENRFFIQIEDNGSGFDTDEKKNGHYGLENIRFRAKELGADLVIESEQSKGTSVSIARVGK
ncbi:MAG TPA: two-component regulator propeller domain-containing protein [Parafilimonas sp.]|nr:two-component regulator propeller domain-containing protein [Parafilimonas sp.]